MDKRTSCRVKQLDKMCTSSEYSQGGTNTPQSSSSKQHYGLSSGHQAPVNAIAGISVQGRECKKKSVTDSAVNILAAVQKSESKNNGITLSTGLCHPAHFEKLFFMKPVVLLEKIDVGTHLPAVARCTHGYSKPKTVSKHMKHEVNLVNRKHKSNEAHIDSGRYSGQVGVHTKRSSDQKCFGSEKRQEIVLDGDRISGDFCSGGSSNILKNNGEARLDQKVTQTS